ncbi:unnamed protein product [Paramecium sonneborni]|uniref:Uncharacterized protein n=1 Tax=Paramecium sonneborni TaxID=65129 RepID=A0A8S1MUI7_9CILI|nr:unnamed protein product [Paramecium sonneborni]
MFKQLKSATDEEYLEKFKRTQKNKQKEALKRINAKLNVILQDKFEKY